MNLFVDDDREFKLEGWVVARTITEAIRMITSQPIDTISLDHDCGRPGDDFTAVAYFIRYMPTEMLPKRIVIHSGNSEGVKRLYDILEPLGLPIYVKLFYSEQFYKGLGE